MANVHHTVIPTQISSFFTTYCTLFLTKLTSLNSNFKKKFIHKQNCYNRITSDCLKMLFTTVIINFLIEHKITTRSIPLFFHPLKKHIVASQAQIINWT